MRPSLGFIGIGLLAAAALTLAAPIHTAVAPSARTLQLALPPKHQVAAIHKDLESRTDSGKSSDTEKQQLLSRGAVTLDLLGKVADTSSHAVHGAADMSALTPSAAADLDAVSTELRMLTGNHASTPLHPVQELTLPALDSRPRIQQLLGRAKWRKQQTVGTINSLQQRLTDTTRLHADQPTGSARWRRPSQVHQSSRSYDLGMADSHLKPSLPQPDRAASPVPQTASPQLQQKAATSPPRAPVQLEAARQPTSPAVTANADRGSHEASVVADPVRTTAGSSTLSSHGAGKATAHEPVKGFGKSIAQTDDAKSALKVFAEKQANLYKAYVRETKYGMLHARRPELIDAEGYIVSRFGELEAESPAAADALVQVLRSAHSPDGLAKAGIVNPGFTPGDWAEAARVIVRRNRAHERRGTYARQVAALEAKSARATRGVDSESSSETSSSSNRKDGRTDASSNSPVADTGATSAPESKRQRDSTKPDPREAKRARHTTALEAFVEKQQDLFNLSHGPDARTKRRKNDEVITELERQILSQYKELKPTDEAHAEDLLEILQSSSGARKLAEAGIVKPEGVEDPWWNEAAKAIYRRNKSNVYNSTYARELEELKQSRLRAKAEAES